MSLSRSATTVTRRPSQHIGGFVRCEQPTIRFLVLDRPSLGRVDLGRGAIENLCAHQTNDAATNRIDRNGRVQKQAELTIVAGSSEAVFAVGVTGEVEFRSVLDRQHVARCPVNRPVVVSISP